MTSYSYPTHAITFVCLNDYEAEAFFSSDNDDGIIWLETCKLGGLEIHAKTVAEIMGNAEYERQMDIVQAWWEAEGFAEYARNDADDYGDYLYERARDDRMDAA